MAESLAEDEGTVSSGENPVSRGFLHFFGDLSLWKNNSRMPPASMAPLGVGKESPSGHHRFSGLWLASGWHPCVRVEYQSQGKAQVPGRDVWHAGWDRL